MTRYSITWYLLFAASLVSATAQADLNYGTYIGGPSIEYPVDIAVDDAGQVVILGQTEGPGFPVTAGAYDTSYEGMMEIVVMKLTPDLSGLVAATYVGYTGSTDDMEYGNAMVVGADGRVSVIGDTWNNYWPTTDDAWYSEITGLQDVILFQLSADLSELLFSTYVGFVPYTQNWGNDLAQDSEGNIFATGAMGNDSYEDYVFVWKLGPDLKTFIDWIYIDEPGDDRGHLIDVSPGGEIIVFGTTDSADFPVTPGVYDESWNGDGSYFVAALTPDLGLARASFLPYCHYRELILDREDDLVMAGYTPLPDFPVTPGAFDTSHNGERDGVVLCLSADFTTLRSATYLGGTEDDVTSDVIVLEDGSILVSGWSRSPEFPVTPGTDATLDGESDGILVAFEPDLSAISFGTFLGGGEYESLLGVTADSEGRLAVTGTTSSPDFPTSPTAFDRSLGGYTDIIAVRFDFTPWSSGKFIIAGPGPSAANPPLVRVFPPGQDASSSYEFAAYEASSFGVNVSAGDVTGDGLDDILTGAGQGAIYGPHVRGFQVDGTPLPQLSFLAYGTNKYGVNVAAGDIDADGFDEVITGAGPGAVFGPHVRAFDYDGTAGVTPVPGVSYFAYGTPKWGVNVSAGDLDGDGFDEIVTGAGPGSVYGPHVRGWDVDGDVAVPISGVSFLAYGTNKYGVNVSCGDLDGDGMDEIVTGAGPGAAFGAHVRGWNYDGDVMTELPGVDFFAWPPGEAGFGARVYAGADLDGDGRDDVVVGPGPDPSVATPIKVYRYDEETQTEWFSLEAYDGLSHGVTVAAGRF